MKKYKNFFIKKNHVLNTYSILDENYNELFWDVYPKQFGKLKDAKEFINNSEYNKSFYNFKKTF